MKKTFILMSLTLLLLAGCAETGYRESKIRIQHRDWNEQIIQKVAKRQVEKDMTGEMVREAIGLPDKIDREGNREKWSYAVMVGDYQPVQKFVYFVFFKNNRVTRTEGDISRLKTFSWYD